MTRSATGLSSPLRQAVEAAIRQHHGGNAEVTSSRPASGGCIHDSRFLELADGRRFFLKADRVEARCADLFVREAEGLTALAEADALRVPRDPIPGRVEDDESQSRSADTAFLLLEAIPNGQPGPTFWEDFGRSFARLHQQTALRPGTPRPKEAREPGPRPDPFGFAHDNYLGGTPQPNGWSDDWMSFFRQQRLAHQLDLARARGHATGELERRVGQVMDCLEILLDLPEEPGCLLHGDLWSGNFLADDAGSPVLIDPAAYHGHREADLAMTRLFGGFERRFYTAYEEVWPLPEGTRRRQDVYQLYHLLNHLNLFGGSYLAQSLSLARRLT